MNRQEAEEYSRLEATRRSCKRRCTGLTARWCPIHGDCTCPNPADRDDFGPSDMDDMHCPLHGEASDHPIGPEVAAS